MTDKPPLFFIHGMWSRPRVWDAIRAHFDALGHETHAPALPFHDLEPGAPAPPELGSVGLRDYIDALVAAAPAGAVVLGHSMGGMLAQAVAERVQPKGLVLLSPAPTATTGRPDLASLRTTFGVTKQWGWWRQPTKLDAERARWGVFNEVPADVATAEIDALTWDSGRVLAQLAFPWTDSTRGAKIDYARLAMPALVVVGDRDRITPVATARATVRQLAGPVDYRELPGVGHWLFHEPVRGRVIAEIERFLGRL